LVPIRKYFIALWNESSAFQREPAVPTNGITANFLSVDSFIRARQLVAGDLEAFAS